MLALSFDGCCGRVRVRVALFALWIAFAATVAVPAPALAEAGALGEVAGARQQEYWLEMRLAGVPTGYVLEDVSSTGDGGYRTGLESAMVLNRMDARVEIRTHAVLVEDAAGQLRSARVESSSSADATIVDVLVRDDTLQLRTHAGGRDYRQTVELSQPLLGPQRIHALSRERLRMPGDRFEFSTFVPEYAAVAVVAREVTGRESLQVADRHVDAVVISETQDLMPVSARHWLDEDGRIVRTLMDSPFGTVESVRSDADVRAVLAAGAELPEESYQNAIARSNIRLPQARSLESVQVRIDLERDGSVMPALDGPDQRLLERSDRHAIVEIRRGETPGDGADAHPDEVEQYRQANAYLQSDHPDVVALARSLHRPELDAWAQSRILQDWVAANMEFDAGIAMVSASEAVRDRRGTCVAYAVLLTSLARALDIPARVVMGYVYAANMWGGHAWTEVFVDGRWLALDAAVWRPGPADPARIGVLRTSLEQGMTSGVGALAQMYGNERVRVMSYTLDGRRIEVPADAVAYQSEAASYRNPWLGIALQAPAGFTVGETDAMYPRNDVVVLRDADGSRLVLEQASVRHGEDADQVLPEILHGLGFDRAGPETTGEIVVAGRQGLLVEQDDRAGAVWRDGSDVWFAHGRGDDIGRSLRSLLARLEMDAGIGD